MSATPAAKPHKDSQPRRMGRAQRNPSCFRAGIDGYRFAPPILRILHTRSVSPEAHSRANPTFRPSPEFVNRCRGRVPSGLRSAAYGYDGYGFEHARDEGGGHAAADPDLDHQAE